MKDDESTAEVLKAQPLRILFVEDDEFDVAVFGRAFRQSLIPCEIVRCRSSEEALEGLRDAKLSIDLLVADYQLPGMSGYDLCLELLAGEPDFALVLLTGGGSEQMAIQALRAGIQDYIVKDASKDYLDLLPVVLPRVARRHRQRMARRRAQRRARRQAPATPERAAELTNFAAVVSGRGGRTWVDEDGAAPMLHFAVPLAADEVAAWTALGDVADPGVELPPAAAGKPPSTGREPAASPAEPAAEGLMRVLIAHPNAVVTYVASRAAEREGCRFVVVENGRKAVEALDREPFDLILMGVHMPDLDGLEATRRIRSREGATARRVRIVGLGVDPESGEVEACLAAGMDAALPRPVEPVGLCAVLAG